MKYSILVQSSGLPSTGLCPGAPGSRTRCLPSFRRHCDTCSLRKRPLVPYLVSHAPTERRPPRPDAPYRPPVGKCRICVGKCRITVGKCRICCRKMGRSCRARNPQTRVNALEDPLKSDSLRKDGVERPSSARRCTALPSPSGPLARLRERVRERVCGAPPSARCRPLPLRPADAYDARRGGADAGIFVWG